MTGERDAALRARHAGAAGDPVLLLLHGGPGRSVTPLAPVLRPWEAHFTVVMWDQRGAGRTFGRNGVHEQPMTVDRLVQDGIEVAEYLRQRLAVRTIILRDIRRRFTPMVLFAPDYSLWDIRDFLSASDFTGPALFEAESTFDARDCCTRFAMPVFILNGDHDTITPAELVEPWFRTVEAPAKRFQRIVDGGHSAVLTMPEAFLPLLLRQVRPLAVAAG